MTHYVVDHMYRLYQIIVPSPHFALGGPANQFRLGKRHWNLETSSAVVEFSPPYFKTGTVVNFPRFKEIQKAFLSLVLHRNASRLYQSFNGVQIPLHGEASKAYSTIDNQNLRMHMYI